MKLELKRDSKLSTLNSKPSISGSLYISGTYICDTEENPCTALPAGEYRIVRHLCKQYGRKMPVILTAMSNEQRDMSLENHPDGKLTAHSSQLIARCGQCEQLELVSNNTSMPQQCPMLKPGNGVHHRKDGSIILGTRIIPGALKHPLHAFIPLAERIRKAIARGHKVHLVVSNEL